MPPFASNCKDIFRYLAPLRLAILTPYRSLNVIAHWEQPHLSNLYSHLIIEMGARKEQMKKNCKENKNMKAAWVTLDKMQTVRGSKTHLRIGIS